jgi:hypothetical protein
MDHERGIDVLKITPGGTAAKRQKVKAPFLPSWRNLGRGKATYKASATFGWVCPIAL